MLAYLLRAYYRKRGKRAVLFSRPSRPKHVCVSSYLDQHCERAGYYGIQLDHLSNHDIIFIIDEAQMAYSDGELWEFIKSKQSQRNGPKFCIFTVYGSPSQGMREWTDPTPDPIRSVAQVSIIRSNRENSPDIGLFYDDTEFEDVLIRYCTHPATKLPLEEAARRYLYTVTNGHPDHSQIAC